MSFDFTGLGNSDGEFENTDFSSNISDLIDAANFLAAEYQSPSLLIGHSFGGAASIFAAQSLPDIKALVTIGSPSNVQHISHLFEDHLDTIKEKGVSIVHIGGRAFGINHSFLQDLKEKDLGSSLSQLRKPLLILHSPQDGIVEISHAAILYDMAFHPKSFISLDGADHLLSHAVDSKYVGEMIFLGKKIYPFPNS